MYLVGGREGTPWWPVGLREEARRAKCVAELGAARGGGEEDALKKAPGSSREADAQQQSRCRRGVVGARAQRGRRRRRAAGRPAAEQGQRREPSKIDQEDARRVARRRTRGSGSGRATRAQRGRRRRRAAGSPGGKATGIAQRGPRGETRGGSPGGGRGRVRDRLWRGEPPSTRRRRRLTRARCRARS